MMMMMMMLTMMMGIWRVLFARYNHGDNVVGDGDCDENDDGAAGVNSGADWLIFRDPMNAPRHQCDDKEMILVLRNNIRFLSSEFIHLLPE